jgi:4-amino-4-deoxy-L-arabinose transferase-like glycosyltransferase
MASKRTQAADVSRPQNEEHANGQDGAVESVVEAKVADARSDRAPMSPAEWLVWLRETVRTERLAVIVVIVAGILLFLPFLGTLGLWDPWETHYGEVAREMIQRDDYVYPYWESSYFFSKPVLPLWMMALGLQLVGAENPAMPDAPLGAWTEWGARIPFAIVAIATMWAVYKIGTLMRDRATGLLATFVLASSAQFIFIGKQAMVDMPCVGFMVIGLALFMGAVFDREDDKPATPMQKSITCSAIGLAVFIQLILIGREMKNPLDFVALSVPGVIALGFIAYVLWRGSRHDCWLVGFYVLMGLSALSKGPVPLLIVGPTVVLYCLLSGDWRLLLRSKVYVGWLLFLAVALPWYITLSLFNGRDEEGKTFFQRFILHDMFGRFGAGVHGDRANLGYFVEQIAYGMFPWAAMLPAALGFAVKGSDIDEDQRRRRVILFVLLWGVTAYVSLSMSQTKFHHYIFPALPAYALLIGDWLVHVAEDPAKRLKLATAAVIVLLVALIARDILNEPQVLVNLFTYKYDRDYPRDVDIRPYVGAMLALGGGAIVFFWVIAKNKANVLLSFFGLAFLFGAWISHHHFNMLTPHWSQAHLFKTYFEERKGNEPLFAYQLNWRGETFYSRNKVMQIKENGADQRMRTLVDRPGREFIITEQSRFHTLQGILSPDKRDKIHILDRSNNKFYLVVVDE